MSVSMSASGMAAAPIPNTPGNVARGLAYLDTLHGEGGTEMVQGIRAALGFPEDPERLRVVMFLTDGFIGNETQILGEIRQKIGGARLYSFGVGSSVNRYLLENMALEGRGAVRYVRYDEDATEPVRKFYDQVRSPVLTDIAIDWDGLEVTDLYPARVPDLFAGQPLLVTGRYARGGDAHVKVRGRIGNEDVALPVDVSLPDVETRNTVLRSLWARQAIEERMRSMLQAENPATVAAVVDLSIRHRVLSQYTAFVAVEEKVRTNERGQPERVEVPVELPDGVSFDGVFGKDKAAEQGVAAGRAGGMLRGSSATMAVRKSAVLGVMSGGGYGMGLVGTGAGGGGMGSVGTRAEAARPSAAPTPVATAVAAPDRKAKPKEAAPTVSVRVHILASVGGFAGAFPAAFERVRPSIEKAIRACAAGVAASLPVALSVEVIADAKGAVVSVRVLNPPPGLDKALSDCIVRAFRSVKTSSAGSARFDVRF
jgi:Ca-activated chloride channel family protein